MQTPDTPQAAPGRRGRYLPVALSSLVYPGLGQMVQRRWCAAGLYALGFTAAFAWFTVAVVRILTAYYGFMADFGGDQPLPTVHMGQMLAACGVAMLVYVANVADAAMAARKADACSRPPVAGSG